MPIHGDLSLAAISRKLCCLARLFLLLQLLGMSLDPATGQSVIPKLVFSPWAKFCPDDRDSSGRHFCQTIRLGRTETGQPIVAAILTEFQGDAKKYLRLVVPIGVQIPQGTRHVVDDDQPMSAPYIGCFSKGCMADYEATADLIGRLKSGQALAVQAIDGQGHQESLNVPLSDFAKVYGGAPSKDAKLFRALKEQLPQRDRQGPGEPPRQVKGAQLVYSPWTKLCKTGDGLVERLCFTGKDGRFGSGQTIVAAVLIEPESGEKKKFRVTLPLGMEMPQGTRVIVDDSEPLTAPYVVCFTSGCVADYEAGDELIGRLKAGKGLTIQGINSQGKAMSFLLPLTDFAKALDSPPMDPRELEERQKELQKQPKKGAEYKRNNGH